MDQACDLCGPAVQATYRLARQGELYLCRHCTTRLRAALSPQGWAIWPVSPIKEETCHDRNANGC